MKNILFYGDSNTWGYDPSTGDRYPYGDRWTTICAGILGDGYNCIPAGMNGRTTAFDDPLKGCRNGISGLDYELQSHKPLDLMVIMLGTNDLKYTDARGSAEGMRTLVAQALSANERFHLSSPVFPKGAELLLISPILLTGSVNENIACHESAESEKLADLYREIAGKAGIHFLDAAPVTHSSLTDGVHLAPEGHVALGNAISQKIRKIFEEYPENV